jgi:fermentation-respiration switch protein FrsA (DUF1100 family)
MFTMLKLIHLLIETIYLLCPAWALVHTIRLPRGRDRQRGLARIRLTAIAGMGAGALVCVVYAFALSGRLLFTQVLLAGYLATSLMLILQSFDRLLWNLGRWIFQLDREKGLILPFALRAMLGLLLRASIVFCIGLPYVLATVMTYRPRVLTAANPQTLFQWDYQRVEFPATDGTRVVGWWIPSPAADSGQTVLLCPGSNADKATQLSLVRRLLPAGYNVLVFDFRAHGESGGQLCSFGDLERNDVLGAMRWLRQTHPSACRKVDGLGVSTGGAALLAAAADPSPEGQNIDAIAIYDTYDRLDNVVGSLVNEFVPSPLSWFVDHLGLPLAGYQVGASLQNFSPASQIKAIWPRPVLIIHGMDDEFIPFEEGQALYDSALEPKLNFWISRCNHAGALKNDPAARLVKKYFDSAQRVI